MSNGTKTGELEQLVVFTLAKESYGVDIGKVNGIERMQNITRVPKTPEHVKGVMNLRGRVIPVVSMRTIFRLPSGEETKDTRIVVADVQGQQIGVIVDAVTEVLRIPADSIESVSSIITSGNDAEYMLGIAKLEGKMIILLDLDMVLDYNQTIELEEMTKTTTETLTQEVEAVTA